jgi:hypothetical protein
MAPWCRAYQAPPLPTIPEHTVVKSEYDAQEFFRFLHLLAHLREPGPQRPTLPEWEEYQRLLGKYGVETIDAVTGRHADPARTPTAAEILQTDCKPIPGDRPLICPRSEPRLPPELLPCVEQRCRQLGRVGPGGTVLWVGRGAEIETMCLWDHRCDCFGPTERVERLGRVAASLVREVRHILRAATGSEEFAAALARASDSLRVLGPLRTIYKSGLGPDFPPRELALAFIGLSGALDLIRKHLPSAGPTGAGAEQMAELLDRLATDYAEFLAAAGGVWPSLAAPSDFVLPPTGGVETPEPSAAAAACANGLLRFEPGAFVYRSHREELSGKPLQVLQALARARGHVLTLVALQSQC